MRSFRSRRSPIDGDTIESPISGPQPLGMGSSRAQRLGQCPQMVLNTARSGRSDGLEAEPYTSREELQCQMIEPRGFDLQSRP
jgi:hypothetical protein